MKRQLPALVAAFLITLFVTLVMSVVGVDAIFNPNSVAVSNSAPAAPVVEAAPVSANDAGQVQQLQSLVSQYQQRETQYQQMLQSDQQQLDQASAQIQQYQQILLALQDQGLIRILNDGRIQITGYPASVQSGRPGGRSDSGESDH